MNFGGRRSTGGTRISSPTPSRTTRDTGTVPAPRGAPQGPRSLLAVLGVVIGVGMLARPAAAQAVGGVELMELTISRAHEAMLAGTLTAHDLVQAYVARIDAYDKQGPALNALLRLNPRALARADSLDRELARTGRLTGPLHGIPFIVKDNYDTHDMPTTAGSASLGGSRPADDAFLVRRIREAGAIVLAKSNMAEFAFSAFETVGSAMPGHTFNPYALNRVPAGSSGGTAAAVAANFAMVGFGTDTGNSVRGPASHTALVGLRATQGLTSRDGIVPLAATRDVGGPLARTVEDAVRVLDVIAGTDPADPVTAEADRRRPDSYLGAMRTRLEGVRIGVVGALARTPTADPEVVARFDEALTDLRALGAELVDPVEIPELAILRQGLFCPRFRYDLERYLATLPNPPVRTLAEIAGSGLVHTSAMGRIQRILVDERTAPDEDPRCVAAAANEERLREAVRAAMRRHALVALVYPTWSNPPRLIGDLDSPHGNNSEALAPPTGFPAISVPMGFVGTAELPTGLQIMGDAWDEATILGIAHAYEQATRHRRPPATTPPLGGG